MALEDARHQVDTAFTRPELRGMAYENTFGGATSFLRRRYSKDMAGVDLAVFGVPFDQAVTNRPGTRFGPRAIREASSLQVFDAPYGWDFNPLEDFAIVDAGDLAFDYARPADFPDALSAAASGILAAGPGLLALGGDHSISLPLLRACAERFGPLALVQFDAHTDTWADDDLTRHDHGTMFYKAVKLGLIDPAHSVQLGIRTHNPDTLGIRVIDAPEIQRRTPQDIADEVLSITNGCKAYLTFDIDFLDPAFAPGTGTPVWGGPSSAQAAAILRGLRGLDLVAGDVVEVSPPYDHGGITAVAGAHAALEILCLYFWNKRKKP